MNGGWGISYEIALRWMPLDLTDDKPTLIQVMAWCRQATSHYLSHCWPRSMTPNGVIRPQWVNSSPPSATHMHQWIGSTSVQVIACCLFCTKPLSEPNVDLLSIGTLGTNFSEIGIKIIQNFSQKCFWKCRLWNGGYFFCGQNNTKLFTKMLLKMSSVKWWIFFSGEIS